PRAAFPTTSPRLLLLAQDQEVVQRPVRHLLLDQPEDRGSGTDREVPRHIARHLDVHRYTGRPAKALCEILLDLCPGHEEGSGKLLAPPLDRIPRRRFVPLDAFDARRIRSRQEMAELMEEGENSRLRTPPGVDGDQRRPFVPDGEPAARFLTQR